MTNSALTGTIFEGRKFDIEKFITLPKCKGQWTEDERIDDEFKTNAGCLLTAMYHALGLPITMVDIDPVYTKPTDALAENLGMGIHFAETVITLYDESETCEDDDAEELAICDHKQNQAIDLVFEFLTKAGLHTPTAKEKQEFTASVDKCNV